MSPRQIRQIKRKYNTPEQRRHFMKYWYESRGYISPVQPHFHYPPLTFRQMLILRNWDY